MVNPYLPGQPANPTTFAGRADLLARFDEALIGARDFRRSAAILLYGYRGAGKTSAIRKLRAIAKERFPEAIAVEVPLRERSVTEARLLAALISEVKREAEGSASITDRLRGFLGRIRGVTIGPAGLMVDGPAGPISTNALTLWRECLASLEGVPLLLVAVDDAELLADDGLATLKTIAESQSPTPILLVVAGSLDLSDRLGEKVASPVGRVFSGNRFDIGEFSERETADALTSPLRSVGSTSQWDATAMAQVHGYAHGYPYLVQCFAFATYRDNATITGVDVDASLEKALNVGGPWLENECADASDADVIAFYKIAGTGKPGLRSTEITALGIQSPYIGRLVRQQILKKVARGHYELRKAPAIAYFHMLRRRIVNGVSSG